MQLRGFKEGLLVKNNNNREINLTSSEFEEVMSAD